MNISYRNGEVHTDNWDGVQARAKARFEPGMAYPISEIDYITPEMKRADVSGIFDGIPVREDPVIPSTRDELFIKGKLD